MSLSKYHTWAFIILTVHPIRSLPFLSEIGEEDDYSFDQGPSSDFESHRVVITPSIFMELGIANLHPDIFCPVTRTSKSIGSDSAISSLNRPRNDAYLSLMDYIHGSDTQANLNNIFGDNESADEDDEEEKDKELDLEKLLGDTREDIAKILQDHGCEPSPVDPEDKEELNEVNDHLDSDSNDDEEDSESDKLEDDYDGDEDDKTEDEADEDEGDIGDDTMDLKKRGQTNRTLDRGALELLPSGPLSKRDVPGENVYDKLQDMKDDKEAESKSSPFGSGDPPHISSSDLPSDEIGWNDDPSKDADLPDDVPFGVFNGGEDGSSEAESKSPFEIGHKLEPVGSSATDYEGSIPFGDDEYSDTKGEDKDGDKYEHEQSFGPFGDLGDGFDRHEDDDVENEENKKYEEEIGDGEDHDDNDEDKDTGPFSSPLDDHEDSDEASTDFDFDSPLFNSDKLDVPKVAKYGAIAICGTMCGSMSAVEECGGRYEAWYEHLRDHGDEFDGPDGFLGMGESTSDEELLIDEDVDVRKMTLAINAALEGTDGCDAKISANICDRCSEDHRPTCEDEFDVLLDGDNIMKEAVNPLNVLVKAGCPLLPDGENATDVEYEPYDEPVGRDVLEMKGDDES